MKKFAVYIVVGENDRRIGTVYAHDEHHAMTMIPEKYSLQGRIVLVPIIIES